MAQAKSGQKSTKKVTAGKKVALKMQNLSGLWRWNIALAAVFALQALVLALLSNGKSLPVVSNYLTKDPLQTAAQGTPVLVLATHHLLDINVLYVLVAGLLVAAAHHVLVATVWRKRYEADLARSRNELRWTEYAITASLLLITIGLLLGVQDAAVLFAVAALVVVMHLGALVTERSVFPGQKLGRLNYLTGAIAGLTPWLLLTLYLFGSTINGTGTPGYLYWLLGSMVVIFAGFAVNFVLQRRQVGKWKDYVYGERVYMVISFVAKAALVWQVFAGALR
jgi:hypothetical protein